LDRRQADGRNCPPYETKTRGHRVNRWFRNIRLRRRARDVFPPSLLCGRSIAEERFRDALGRARSWYREILETSPSPKGFVHPEWEENIREVERYFLERFEMAFLGHPRINGTMVFTDRAAHAAEWSFLETWRPGDTLRNYLAGGMNDGFLEGKLRHAALINSTHHLYHLARFEKFLGEPIDGIGTVVEFGGGYGNLARIFRNVGHLSRYTIIDLPLFCCIQYVFLSTLFGPEAVRLVAKAGEKIIGGTINLVPIPFLEDVHMEGELFVSTWALSESPAAAYDHIRERDWCGARKILLGFNDGWKPWNADELVEALRKKFRRVVTEPLPFLPGNQYLMAMERSRAG
jgi:hypothetical protein